MQRQPHFVAIALAALTGLMATACHGTDEALVPVRVTGRIVDDETGKPVSRRTIWVHGFNDELGEKQVGQHARLEPEDTASFALRLATANVRLRIFDKSNTYELFEQNFTATGGVLDVEARLKPTHWIVLHGKVLWRDGATLRPIREGDDNVRNALISIHQQDFTETFSLADDGSYSMRVPRDVLRIYSVDTNRVENPNSIDLRGTTEAERQFDVTLEVWHGEPNSK